MKRADLSAESTNSTPPFHFGWLATIPIVFPSRRPKPVTTSRANSFLISKNEPASITRSITSKMSNGRFSSFGIAASSSAGGRAGSAPARSGSGW